MKWLRWNHVTRPTRMSGASSLLNLSYKHPGSFSTKKKRHEDLSEGLIVYCWTTVDKITITTLCRSLRSSPIFRAFYVPFLSEHYTTYRRYVILKPRRQKQPRKRTHGWLWDARITCEFRPEERSAWVPLRTAGILCVGVRVIMKHQDLQGHWVCFCDCFWKCKDDVCVWMVCRCCLHSSAGHLPSVY